MSYDDELHSITQIKEISIIKRNFSFPEKASAARDVAKYNFRIGIDSQIDEHDNTIIKDVIVKVETIAEKPELIAEIQVLFSFEVQDLSNYIVTDQNKYNLDKRVSKWLNNVSIATTRGIMYSELKGTFLDRALLPLINPDTL